MTKIPNHIRNLFGMDTLKMSYHLFISIRFWFLYTKQNTYLKFKQFFLTENRFPGFPEFLVLHVDNMRILWKAYYGAYYGAYLRASHFPLRALIFKSFNSSFL